MTSAHKSPEDEAIVAVIRRHFADPHAFVACAAAIWAMYDPSTDYTLTAPSRDGGRNAYGYYKLGPEADPMRLDFALEAKCYAADNWVGVRELSRLITPPAPPVWRPCHHPLSRPAGVRGTAQRRSPSRRHLRKGHRRHPQAPGDRDARRCRSLAATGVPCRASRGIAPSCTRREIDAESRLGSGREAQGRACESPNPVRGRAARRAMP